MTIGIDDYFLLSTLPCAEYIRILVPILPDDIREEFQLDRYIHNGTFDYFPFKTGPFLFRHKTKGVAFTLVVDDFLIKYKEHVSAMHLLTALQERYPLMFDWSPCQYLVIDTAFDKSKRTVKLSIPGYIPKMLRQFDPNGLVLLLLHVSSYSLLKVLKHLRW